MMRQHKVWSVMIATVFFVVMMAWGVILTSTLRGGDEAAAATGTAFIILATIMLGDTVLAYFKITSDGSDLYMYKVSRHASAGVGALFVVLIIISALVQGYRTEMVIRALSYGSVGLLVVFMSSSYVHYAKLETSNEGTSVTVPLSASVD